MKRIIISRTDNLGDVILTLPVAGLLKKHYPDSHIFFLGKAYTRPLIESCEHIDEFLDWEEICRMNAVQYFRDTHADAILHVFPVKAIAQVAKRAGIPLRIGTSHRIYNLWSCNKLIHYSRKRSNLHEAQLNIRLLEGLGIREKLSLKEIPRFYGLKIAPVVLSSFPAGKAPESGRFNLILHPKSKGSAREWGLDNYTKLIKLLPPDKFRIYVTGTASEGLQLKEFLAAHSDRVTDMTGKLSLEGLISFISMCDGMVAASTGPLHIAAALGKKAIGIYSPMRPIFPQRWAPLGIKADYLVLDKKCNKCRGKNDCECIRDIRPEDVAKKLLYPM